MREAIGVTNLQIQLQYQFIKQQVMNLIALNMQGNYLLFKN